MQLDPTDRRLLAELQRDSTTPLDELGQRVGLSRNACWRRIKAMEAAGIIRARVALVDAAKVDLAQTVFVLIRAARHDADWADRFARAVRGLPQITGVYRMSGDLDYLLRAQVRDVADYDRLYKALIDRVDLAGMSASFVMETLKDGTALPV
jgi:Lrp/AsnC family transcriptional regulator